MSLINIISFIIAINFVLSVDQERLIKKAKVAACLGLANAKMEQDKSNFEKMTKTLGKDKKGLQMGMEHILQVLLINCYQNIEEDQIGSILEDTKNKKLNTFNAEYQELLGMGKNVDTSKISLENMSKAAKEINELLGEIKGEEKELLEQMKKYKKTNSKSNTSKTANHKPTYKGEKWKDVIYEDNQNQFSLSLLLNPLKASQVFGFQTLCGLVIMTLIVILAVSKNMEFLKKKGLVQEATFEEENKKDSK